jgi:hypothetical protein
MSIDWCEDNQILFVKEPLNALTGLSFLLVAYKTDNLTIKLSNIFVAIATTLYHTFLSDFTRRMDQISILFIICAYAAVAYKQLSMRLEMIPPFVYLLNGNLVLGILLCFSLFITIYINIVGIDTPIYPDIKFLNSLYVISGTTWWVDHLCWYGIHTHWLFHLLVSFIAYKMIRVVEYHRDSEIHNFN